MAIIMLKDLLLSENWRDGLYPEDIEGHKEWRQNWLKRYEAEFTPDGRLIAYHGTPTRNVKSIKANGFRKKSYFSLRPEYSKHIAARYHDTPENKVSVMKVYLPLEKVDFIMGDIYSTEPIPYSEVV